MKINYIYLLISLFALSFVACETTEKIDEFPLRPPQLVVNCFFTHDSIWEFQVSRSLSVLDNADLKFVPNASIMLFKDNLLLDSITHPDADGWYRTAGTLPQMDQEYSIEVSSPDYEKTLYASELLPNAVAIKEVSITVKDSSFYEWDDYEGHMYYGGNVEGTFNILFNDPPSIENYYEITAFYYDTIYESADSLQYFIQRNLLPLTSEDASVVNNGDNYFKLLASDEVFDGQAYRLKVGFNDWQARRGKSYMVLLTSLNKSGFLYRKSIDDYNKATGDPFSEPVQVFCNIENGYGIFAGYATYTQETKLKSQIPLP